MKRIDCVACVGGAAAIFAGIFADFGMPGTSFAFICVALFCGVAIAGLASE